VRAFIYIPSRIQTLGGDSIGKNPIAQYGEIVLSLAETGRRTGISRKDLEDALIVSLEVVRPETIARHIRLMERLGYLRRMQGPSISREAEYDLVGEKVTELRRQRSLEESLPKMKGGKPRL